MNVQNVLLRANIDYIYKSIENSCGQELAKKRIDEYRKLLKTNPVYNPEKIVICAENIDEKAFEFDYSIVENISVHLFDKIDILVKKIPTYEETLVVDFNQEFIYGQSIAFESWKKLLGYDISDVSIEAYGINACAYAIFDEITSAGVKYEAVRDTVQVTSGQYVTVNTSDIVNCFEEKSEEDFFYDILEQNKNAIANDEYLSKLVYSLREDIQTKNKNILDELLSMEKHNLKSKSIRMMVRL